jgi:hypothetical protein
LLPPKPAGPRRDLEREIERLRQSGERFSRIDVEVRDRIVYVRGGDDARFAFAELIARLPHVERVIVVDLPPAPRPVP